MGCRFRLTGYGRPSAGKNPVHYRDARNEWQKPETGRCPYARRKNCMPIPAIKSWQSILCSSCWPCVSRTRNCCKRLRRSFFMPDLFAALLGAEPVCERSIASTSQMLGPPHRAVEQRSAGRLRFAGNRFAPIVASGTVTGTLANGAKSLRWQGMIHNAPRLLCRVPRKMPNIRHFSPAARGACWERNWTPRF